MNRSLRLITLGLFSLSLLSAQKIYSFREPDRQHSYRIAQSSINGAPVLYDLSELPSAARLASMPEEGRAKRLLDARRIVTAKLLVQTPAADDWSKVNATAPRQRRPSALKGWWVVEYASPLAAFTAAEQLLTTEGAPAFSPVFARHMEPRQALQRSVNDPLYPKQWNLSADEKVSVRPGTAWDSVTGKGINIAVVDDGLDVMHEDLAGNTYPIEGGYHVNFNGGKKEDPTPLLPKESHGTQCAGLIAARGFNNIGLSGVAPEARLMGVRLIAGDADDEQTGIALTWQPKDVVTHISSNSWGPADDGAAAGRVGPLQAAALETGATSGRGGLGIVYVISAGNGRGEDDDSSYDEFSSSRFAIGVGAVNRKGEASSYSEAGMNVAISAPGGESSPPDVLWTTNIMGAAAYQLMKKDFETTQAPINYSDAFNGTSAAAPQVSGAAALMLERNPKLGYRDVKEILMKTARRDALTGGDEFTTNGGGFTFSHSFGAGLLNISAALAAAADWKNLGPLLSQSVAIRSDAPVRIPDGDLDGLTGTFDFDGAKLRVESVELVVDVPHGNRGDLAFLIQSPSGMISIAAPRPNDEGEDFLKYKFTSVRHWGETSTGSWKVRVIDTEKNGSFGSVEGLTLRLFGTAQ
ncbi:MAG: S8 family serine peptidase [Bryobacteraceae bacterium]|nr:S8 family serine peptidase [Bryobacteraceae bacterium]